MVSRTGYRDDSPDKENPYNIIPSNRISMKGVSIPLVAVPIKGGAPSLEEARIMKPGEEHEFEGAEAVIEIPVPEGATEEQLMAHVQSVLQEAMKSVSSKKKGGMVRTFKRAYQFQQGGPLDFIKKASKQLSPDIFNNLNTFSQSPQNGNLMGGATPFTGGSMGPNIISTIGNAVGQMATAIDRRKTKKEQNKLNNANFMLGAVGQNINRMNAGFGQYMFAKCGGKIGKRVIRRQAGGEVAASIFNSISAVSPVIPPPFGAIAAGIGAAGNIVNTIIQGKKQRDRIRKQRQIVENMARNLYLTNNESNVYI